MVIREYPWDQHLSNRGGGSWMTRERSQGVMQPSQSQSIPIGNSIYFKWLIRNVPHWATSLDTRYSWKEVMSMAASWSWGNLWREWQVKAFCWHHSPAARAEVFPWRGIWIGWSTILSSKRMYSLNKQPLLSLLGFSIGILNIRIEKICLAPLLFNTQ